MDTRVLEPYDFTYYLGKMEARKTASHQNMTELIAKQGTEYEILPLQSTLHAEYDISADVECPSQGRTPSKSTHGTTWNMWEETGLDFKA